MEPGSADFLPSDLSSLISEVSFSTVITVIIWLFIFIAVVSVPFAIFRWWTLRKARKLGIRGYRTRSFFWRLVPEYMMRARAIKLDTESLLGAFHGPNTRPKARELVRAELEKRGVSVQAIESWQPAPAHLTVPPVVKERVTAEKYARLVRKRRRMFAVLRFVAIVGIPATIVLSLTEEMLDETEQGQPSQQVEQPSPDGPQLNLLPEQTAPDITGKATASGMALAPQTPASVKPEGETEDIDLIDLLPTSVKGMLENWIVQAVSVLVVLLLTGIILIGPYICRNRAVRILLLRPFGAAKLTTALKKVVLRDIGPLGLVYTLEDSNYKPNIFFTIFTYVYAGALYFFGPILKPSVRIASIRSSYTFLKLAGRLSRKYRPAFQNLAIGGQAVSIRCANGWWQRVVDLFMHSSDLIVMDLSIVNEGSSWEVDQLEFRALMDKSLFICHQDFIEQGTAAVERLLPASLRPEIFIYDDKGIFVRHEVFQEALNEQIAKVVEQWGHVPSAQVPKSAQAAPATIVET